MEEDRPGHPSGDAEVIKGGRVKKSGQEDDKDRAGSGGSYEMDEQELLINWMWKVEKRQESAGAGRLEISTPFPPPEQRSNRKSRQDCTLVRTLPSLTSVSGRHTLP